MQKICIYQKKVVPLHQILKITLLTIKILKIMTTKNYFETELSVHFTMSELMTISSALFTDWEDNHKNKRFATAEIDVQIKEKLKSQMDFYNEIIK